MSDPTMVSCCEFVRNFAESHLHRIHHDHVHGYAVTCNNGLFARLVLVQIKQHGKYLCHQGD